jgi:hypothetical protein
LIMRKATRTESNRRDFLRISGLAVAALSVPGWPSAFGQAPAASVKPGETTLLRKASELARSRGLPMLVLRAPADAVLREQLGEMWGAYLSLARRYSLPNAAVRKARLMDLALCEFVCAMDADILLELPPVSMRAAWPSSIGLVVEPKTAAVTLVPGPVINARWSHEEPALTAAELTFVTEIGARVHEAVAADIDMVRRRARENCDTLGDAEKESLSKLKAISTLPEWLKHAGIAPGHLRLLAETSEDVSALAASGLVGDVEKRLDGDIHGSRWEISPWEPKAEAPRIGCSTCGIGFAAEPSVRFLRYFTETGKDVPPQPKK